MRNLLYLVHRLPYPPNKGDKVRSFHLLRHLAATHRVFLGTFVDDPDDLRHVDTLRKHCAEVHVERLRPLMARIRSVAGFATGEALTLPYYRHAGLQSWVDRLLQSQSIDAAVLFSTPMMQYVQGRHGLRRLVDLVDVDSAKWTQYAASRAWPLSWVYRREGRLLLDYEAAAVGMADASFLVTDAEVRLFGTLAPAHARRPEAVGNGVDSGYFSPVHDLASPFARDETAIVFTGAMDYWPNVDGAIWFAREVLPKLRPRFKAVRFYVVGMRPTSALRALAGEGVVVTGTVPDVRPYLRHARVVVAPLRVARGVQNKVLEAMAMAKPVVASSACAQGVRAEPEVEFDVAEGAEAFVERIAALLEHPERASAMGAAARRCVVSRYSWDAQLGLLDRHLGPVAAPEPVPA